MRVRLEQAQAANAIAGAAAGRHAHASRATRVTVVGADGKVSKRTVKIGAAQNNQWVVLDGLKAGEQVMVDGFQKLQMMPPGTPVKAGAVDSAPRRRRPRAGAAAAAAAAAAPAAAAAAEVRSAPAWPSSSSTGRSSRG